MSFKLPDPPSPRAHPHELADFAELLAVRFRTCSGQKVQRLLSQMDDNQENVGIDDDDVTNEGLSDAMMTEIGYRRSACPAGYPFELDPTGSILAHGEEDQSAMGLIYRFLLLATRLSMSAKRSQADIDGTVLMEELSAHILREYLGRDRAESKVFGAACADGFEERVKDLCSDLKEGFFRKLDAENNDAKDDGIDIVGWIPFSDENAGKISVFGQCKTGTSWKDHIHRLDPPGFMKLWMSGGVAIDPIKAFFISESPNRSRWHRINVYGGVVFDRCRIVELSGDLEDDLKARIQAWTDAAMQKLHDWSWGQAF